MIRLSEPTDESTSPGRQRRDIIAPTEVPGAILGQCDAFSSVPSLSHDVAPGAWWRPLQHASATVVLVIVAAQKPGP